MADTANEIILHTKYKFKPENSTNKYVTLYFENTTDDVIISTNIDSLAVAGETTLTEAITTLANVVKNCAKAPVYDTAKSLKKKDLILSRGQFGIESDTLQIKIGDGVTPWSKLNYAITNNKGDEYEQIVVNTTSKIYANDGSGDVTIDLSSLVAANSAPSGTSAYVQILGVQSE